MSPKHLRTFGACSGLNSTRVSWFSSCSCMRKTERSVRPRVVSSVKNTMNTRYTPNARTDFACSAAHAARCSSAAERPPLESPRP